MKKRVRSPRGAPHAGLLPPGFSAEHLGANDWYYWDDFWAVGGLRGAAALLEQLGDHTWADRFRDESEDLLAAIERSLEMTADPVAKGHVRSQADVEILRRRRRHHGRPTGHPVIICSPPAMDPGTAFA